jgi:hypothetical protein
LTDAFDAIAKALEKDVRRRNISLCGVAVLSSEASGLLA